MQSDTLKIFTDAWSQLTHSPVWLVIAVMSLAWGLFLKWLKLFPNRWIPVAVLAFTTFFYAILADKSQVSVPPSTTGWVLKAYPWIICSFYGFLLGFVVWAGHSWIFKRLEKFLPDGFFGSNGFDTVPPTLPQDPPKV